MMHAEGRRYVARIEHDRQRDEECEILAVRRGWDRLSDRDKALILAQWYDDIEIPRPKRWWRR